jgi:hypothetical protein
MLNAHQSYLLHTWFVEIFEEAIESGVLDENNINIAADASREFDFPVTDNNIASIRRSFKVGYPQVKAQNKSLKDRVEAAECKAENAVVMVQVLLHLLVRETNFCADDIKDVLDSAPHNAPAAKLTEEVQKRLAQLGFSAVYCS